MAPVGVDYDLASGKAGIAVRAPYDKLSCRVDKELHVVGKEFPYPCRQFFSDPGEEDAPQVRSDLLLHRFFRGPDGPDRPAGRQYEFVVLGADHDGIDTQGLIVIVIFDRYLRFAVGPEIFHLFSRLSDHCQLLKDVM